MEEQILITYNDGVQFGGFGLFINSTEFRKSVNVKSEKTEQIRQKLVEIIEIAKTINQ